MIVAERFSQLEIEILRIIELLNLRHRNSKEFQGLIDHLRTSAHQIPELASKGRIKELHALLDSMEREASAVRLIAGQCRGYSAKEKRDLQYVFDSIDEICRQTRQG